MVKNKIKFSFYLLITIFLSLGLSISFQSILADYTAPLNNPPTCTAGNSGCDIPVNTGSTNQSKQGMMIVNTDGNTNGFILQSGRMGIGTVSPGTVFHVVGASNNSIFENDSVAVNGYSQIGIRAGSATSYLWTANENSTSWGGANSLNIYAGTGGAMTLWTNAAEKVRITTGGEVGIGTTNPGAYKLNVAGNMFVSGYYDGGACDIAERYNAVEEEKGELEPGDILVLSKNEKLGVEKSKKAYDNLVIGVFSTDPMLVMGSNEKSNDNDNPPVALLGRVPTKVTNENGSIEIGDLIVSSSKPGYGMKCDDYSKCQGAVVGKALENFNEDIGVVEVLINVGM